MRKTCTNQQTAKSNPWPHELHVAEILMTTGHKVKFLPTRSIKTADILLDGVEYEIKSPITDKRLLFVTKNNQIIGIKSLL